MSTITLANSYVAFPKNATINSVNLSDQLTITVALRRNANLENYAYNVMLGESHILSEEEFNEMFSPNQYDIDLVTAFAQINNLTVYKVYTNSATIKLLGTIENFNNAFGVNLKNVTANGRSYLSYNGSITLPSILDGVVIGVIGLDNSLVLSRSIVSSDSASGSVPYTPQQISQAYQFPDGTGTGTCIGIIELGGGYTQENLISTFSLIGAPVPSVTAVSISPGLNNPLDITNSAEVMLDIYAAGGFAPGANLAMYFAVNSFSGFFNSVNAAIHDTVNAPSVISISWGEYEEYWGSTYRNLIDGVFLQAATMGITIIVASGDYGSQASGGFINNYTVQYPASSPYVLTCGGTAMVIDANGNISSEVVWNYGSNGTGGGVSASYSVPPYQTGLKATTYPSGLAATLTGRGIPDVSGQAVGYQFYYGANNSPYPSASGTSAVAPMYAGLIAIINQLTNRRAGFINHTLYNSTLGFNDITSGNNACPANAGYSATIGWDACTGLGSPIGLVLFTLLNSSGMIYPYYNVSNRRSIGQTYPSPQL